MAYSDTQTRKVKEEYGDKVALMGTSPAAPCLWRAASRKSMICLSECMDGARDGRFIS